MPVTCQPTANSVPFGVASPAGQEIYAEAIVGDAEATISAGQDGAKSHEIAVTIMRPGISANGLRYPTAVLERAVPLFEGVAAFADHPTWEDQTRAGGRSIRDLVGVYHGARYEQGRGVVATLRLYPSAQWAFDLINQVVDDRSAGRAVPPFGISADLLITRAAVSQSLDARNGAGPRHRFDVLTIEAVNSADLVFRPAAGGTFDRIVEAIADEPNTKEVPMPEPIAATAPAPSAASPSPSPAVADATAELVAAREAVAAIRAELINTKVAASGLGEKAQALVRAQLAGREASPQAIDAAIAAVKEAFAESGPSPIRGMGTPRAHVSAALTSREQVQVAMERLFGLPIPEQHAHVPRLSGIREAYLLLTGDYAFSGRYDYDRAIAREANETLLAQMDSVCANVMNKALVRDYAAQPKWWAPIVTVRDLRDVKEQSRVLLNDFAALAAVAENGTYANVAWGDAAETYTPTKKGNIVYVSMEAIINDDVHAFTRLPRKLAAAAAVTINETVSALFTANGGEGPAMADAGNVFIAAHGNKGTTALSSAEVNVARVAMLKFQNAASKVLGIVPRYLLVPPDLAFTAQVICQTPNVPGSANNDVNVHAGVLSPIVVPNWTDANNWYLMADPAQIEGIEVGFLNGRQEPELLVQDNPTAGTVFTNDAISWKVRWIYGAGWLDWRAGYGEVVA